MLHLTWWRLNYFKILSASFSSPAVAWLWKQTAHLPFTDIMWPSPLSQFSQTQAFPPSPSSFCFLCKLIAIFKYLVCSQGNTSFSCTLKQAIPVVLTEIQVWPVSSAALLVFSALTTHGFWLEKGNETLQDGWECCCTSTANEIVTWSNYAKIPVCYVG